MTTTENVFYNQKPLGSNYGKRIFLPAKVYTKIDTTPDPEIVCCWIPSNVSGFKYFFFINSIFHIIVQDDNIRSLIALRK